MSLTTALILAFIPLVVIPPLIWFRQKVYKRLKDQVSAQCVQCGTYNTLERLKNYSCKECGRAHVYFDDLGGQLADLPKYECAYCGAENIKGILTCVACSHANKAGIPD